MAVPSSWMNQRQLERIRSIANLLSMAVCLLRGGRLAESDAIEAKWSRIRPSRDLRDDEQRFV
jgi:hypothetical protein